MRDRLVRIVNFMVHDQAAFGGTLLGLGVLYVWLTVFPLGRGEQWAWWAWLISGTIGFLSVLRYLDYGYLDTWHGIGTLLMLPVFVVGMARTRRVVGHRRSPRCLLRNGGWIARRDRIALGRAPMTMPALAAGCSRSG